MQCSASFNLCLFRRFTRKRKEVDKKKFNKWVLDVKLEMRSVVRRAVSLLSPEEGSGKITRRVFGLGGYA